MAIFAEETSIPIRGLLSIGPIVDYGNVPGGWGIGGELSMALYIGALLGRIKGGYVHGVLDGPELPPSVTDGDSWHLGLDIGGAIFFGQFELSPTLGVELGQVVMAFSGEEVVRASSTEDTGLRVDLNGQVDFGFWLTDVVRLAATSSLSVAAYPFRVVPGRYQDKRLGSRGGLAFGLALD